MVKGTTSANLSLEIGQGQSTCAIRAGQFHRKTPLTHHRHSSTSVTALMEGDFSEWLKESLVSEPGEFFQNLM
jgi:hypothetical protein